MDAEAKRQAEAKKKAEAVRGQLATSSGRLRVESSKGKGKQCAEVGVGGCRRIGKPLPVKVGEPLPDGEWCLRCTLKNK